MTTRTLLKGPGFQPVPAGATPKYTAQIQDETGAAIPAASLTTLTLSIVDTRTGAVVNGVSARNILNADRGTVDSAGNLAVQLQAADTALLNVGDASEGRSLIFDWTFAGGAKTGRHQVDFTIVALSGP
jgi:hypothetical protein